MKPWAKWALGGGAALLLLSRKSWDGGGGKEGGISGSGPQPRMGRPGTRPYEGGPVGHGPATVWQASIVEDAEVKTRTLYVAGGQTQTVKVDIPEGPTKVVVWAMLPAIGYEIKIARKKYGIGLGPSGSTPVLSFIANATSKVAGLIPEGAGAASGDPKAAAAQAALDAIVAIVKGMPNLVKKARIKMWTLFRSGKWGTKNKRKAIRNALGLWYDNDRDVAFGVGKLVGYWRLEGDSTGPKWATVSTKPPSSGTPGTKPIKIVPITQSTPTVKATQLSNNYLELEITTPELGYPGEVRFDIEIYES